VILASGPSLTEAQVAQTVPTAADAPVRVIATNSTALSLGKHADVVYASDILWWKTNYRAIDAKRAWTCDRGAAERYGLNWVKGVNRLGLSKERWIHTNGNSGASAINLAYLFGARRILLLGFDMKLGPKGEKHHHPDHPSPMVQSQTFDDWIHKFDFLARDLKAAGCEVINCTVDTALTCFPRSTVEKEM
jgi:hypothetical protein